MYISPILVLYSVYERLVIALDMNFAPSDLKIVFWSVYKKRKKILKFQLPCCHGKPFRLGKCLVYFLLYTTRAKTSNSRSRSVCFTENFELRLRKQIRKRLVLDTENDSALSL